MTTAKPLTRRGRKPAAPRAPHWRDQAACTGTDTDDFYDDRAGTIRRARGICHQCPVVDTCLADTLRNEGLSGYKWGVSGGLTADQRRALRCEILLGDYPNLKLALEITSKQWRHVLYPLRYQGATPRVMADFLQYTFGLEASPATVRLAVWWLGGKAPVRPRRRDGDTRPDWELIRDECRWVVERLRELGATRADIAAYLDASRNAVELAEKAWDLHAQESLEVAA